MDNNEKKLVVAAFIFGGVGILFALISSVLFFVRSGYSSAFGVFSTIISIVLGLAAMLYTYISGKKTLELLNKIEIQNKRLIDKINTDLIKEAYDENGIEAARNRKPGK